ncbi:MAG: hypothetical protein DMG00_17765 [Acidobacteria bacterium]|nr:MAG: hypothetical protein DMG00_17765 [Acidobacteriota bacterium]
MISASLYIIVCSAKNRIRRRLRRLREPRYLVGAIVGVAYMYFSFFARMRGARASIASGRRRSGRPPELPAFFVQAGGSLVALGLFALAALSWLVPFNSSMLEFSDAETDFLFTAPVSRRALLVHRLMRAQLGVIFTSLVTALVFPTARPNPVAWVVAVWVMLTTVRVYFTGVTLARGRLLLGDASVRPVAWAPVAVALAAVAIVGQSLVRTLVREQPSALGPAITAVHDALSSGAAAWVLWPFVAVSRPLFAQGGRPFAAAIAVALVVLTSLFAWVLHSDEALQEAAADAAARRAARGRARDKPAARARATGLTLAPVGRPEFVFFWKNAVQMVRATTGVALLRYAVALTVIAVAASAAISSATQARGLAMTLCSLAIGVAGFSVVLGPQIVRTDLRSDLRHLDLLKAWPVASAAVMRGEMLAPGIALTGVAWLALTCAAILSAAGFPALSLSWRLSIAAAAVVIAPSLVFAQLLIQNAAAVLFPAWVPLGNERPRGVDALGQRLILLGGVLLSVALMMLPGTVAGGVIWFAFQRWVGPPILLPAALVCLSLVVLEILVCTELLAPLYERLDVLAVERAD